MATKSQSDREEFVVPDRVFDYELRRKILRAGQVVLMVTLLIYVIFPIYWQIASTLTPSRELFSPEVNIIPTSVTVENIVLLWQTEFPNQLKNSIIIAAGATTLTAILASLGGYGLARSNFRRKRSLARVVLFSYMIPHIVLGIPLYIMFANLGLLNSHLALILAHTGVSVPFSVWLMWQYFQTLPIAYEEAAWVSGASRLRTLWDVVLPMAVPGIIAVSIFAFAGSWSDFTLATILLTDTSMYTFPIGLHSFIDAGDRFHWGMLNAGGLVITIPAFLLVFFLQKYILEGFNVGR